MTRLGAEVIHVEQRGAGDLMRKFSTLWGIDFTLPGERNAFTEDLLRNKKSLTLDLAKQEGLLHQLVARSDVFLTNLRQAALDKQKMDYPTLSAIVPALIYCHGSGYGARGPLKDSPGNEMMGLARSGVMLGSAHEGAEPIYPSVGLNDRLGAIGMAVGILAALMARERTGVGQLIETSLLGWMIKPAGSRRADCRQHRPESPAATPGGRERPAVQLLPVPRRRLGCIGHGHI